jgi:hypothetical protein
MVPRIPAAFLEEERRALGESWYRQEYCCSFEALQGLVYPDFAARCRALTLPVHLGHNGVGKRVGGIDFGFRNPFAAVWGVLDRNDVLWLTGEHYSRQKPLSYHAERLPREVTWYADPSGANERADLRWAGFVVHEGDNALRPGIAAEAALYRYGEGGEERRAEAPLDEHNHALAALRYLVSRLDSRYQARPRPPKSPEPAESAPRAANVVRFRSFRDFWRDDSLWTPL